MNTWIALFRGINVGGSNVLPMKVLVALLEKAGCRDVKTYIQSGNVILRSSMSEASRMARRIRDAVSDSRGFEPRVLVLDRGELERAVASNPFAGATQDPKTLHLVLSCRAAEKPGPRVIERRQVQERIIRSQGQNLLSAYAGRLRQVQDCRACRAPPRS